MKVILVMAVTADGRIAKDSDHFPDWTSKEDKQFFARVSKEHGAVVMGDKTFETFPAPLKDRLNVVFTLDENPQPREGVKFVSGEPKKVLEDLEKEGFKSVVLGGGALINGLFLKEKLVDELYISVEPKLFGDGLSLFKGDFNVDLEMIGTEKTNDNSIVLKYKVLK